MAGKIRRREGLVAVEVVVETVLDDRPDRHLRAGEQLLHRFGEDMGAVMADQFQRPRIVAHHDFKCGIRHQRIGEI